MQLAGGAGDSQVAGGYDGAGDYLASTELLVEGDSMRQEARYGARAVTLHNKVILTGGCWHCVEVVFVIFIQEV